MTHTYAILKISSRAYEEIKQKLEEAGYQDQFHDDGDDDGIVIDMHGIAIAAETEKNPFFFELIATENIKCGDVVEWDQEKLECHLMRNDSKWEHAIGGAARDIQKGEKVSYLQKGNTRDIIAKMEIVQ